MDFFIPLKGGGGRPQSTTLRDNQRANETPPGFGLRHPLALCQRRGMWGCRIESEPPRGADARGPELGERTKELVDELASPILRAFPCRQRWAMAQNP